MTDRNDELLLALGWRQEDGKWVDPNGKRICAWNEFLRPYDNLQDAVDCVPKKHCFLLGTNNQRSFVTISRNGGLGDEKTIWIASAYADTPAEALSEAILKAMEANHE